MRKTNIALVLQIPKGIICVVRMEKNKIASQRKTHAPWHFLYLRETKIRWCEGEEGEEKVHLLTHATARGVGKNINTSHSHQ